MVDARQRKQHPRAAVPYRQCSVSVLDTNDDPKMRFDVVYSTNADFVETVHVRHRRFTAWMETRRPELRLVRQVDNPFAGNGPRQSNAPFFFFKRKS